MSEHSKSAPVSAILKELLGAKKLTTEQWLQVLENRREILVKCMKTFSQKTLGQLACLDSGDGFYHELYKDNPGVVSFEDKFNLDSRGLYAGNLLSREKDGERFAFGTDHESWLLIKITYFNQGKAGSHKYERADTVQVIRTDLPIILESMKIDMRLILLYFNIVTREWVSHRKTLYDQACKVEEGMREESAILSLVT